MRKWLRLPKVKGEPFTDEDYRRMMEWSDPARDAMGVRRTSPRVELLRFARENYDGAEPQAVARVLRTVPLASPRFDRELLDAVRRSRR